MKEDEHEICVMHESKGPLLLTVPHDTPSVRLALNEHGRLVYREFFLTAERDTEGRPIYR